MHAFLWANKMCLMHDFLLIQKLTFLGGVNSSGNWYVGVGGQEKFNFHSCE